MSNPFDEIRRAVNDASTQLRAADEVATDMARLLDGRLRRVTSTYALARLKAQLRDFNIHTGKWKERP